MEKRKMLFCSLLAFGLITCSFALSAVTGFTLSHPRLMQRLPHDLDHKTLVWISVRYSIPAGRSVYFRAQPMTTRDTLSPHQAYKTSRKITAGRGGMTGSRPLFFTITKGNVVVRFIRIQMLGVTKTSVLRQIFRPVYFCFPKTRYSIHNIRFSPRSPKSLNHNKYVNISFGYHSWAPYVSTEKVFIGARPMTGNSISRNYAASPLKLHPAGKGSSSQKFTIKSGDVTVNRVRFQIWNQTKTKVLYKKIVRVRFLFPKLSSTDIRKLPE